jgi:hypothetical protein
MQMALHYWQAVLQAAVGFWVFEATHVPIDFSFFLFL